MSGQRRSASPVRRSKAHLEAEGWLVDECERRIPNAPVTKDLFGFADLVACKPGMAPMLVQVTSSTNHAARRTKILATHAALLCLMSGFRIVIHSWAPPTDRHPAGRLREEELQPVDFEERSMTTAPAKP